MFQTTKQFSIFGTAVSAFWAPVKMAPVINGTAPAPMARKIFKPLTWRNNSSVVRNGPQSNG